MTGIVDLGNDEFYTWCANIILKILHMKVDYTGYIKNFKVWKYCQVCRWVQISLLFYPDHELSLLDCLDQSATRNVFTGGGSWKLWVMARKKLLLLCIWNTENVLLTETNPRLWEAILLLEWLLHNRSYLWRKEILLHLIGRKNMQRGMLIDSLFRSDKSMV